MGRVFVLLGSNLGDRKKNLDSAIQLLSERAGAIVQASSVYATAAWGNTDQPEFFNQTVEINTPLTPQLLLQTCLSIESELGRKRIVKWGERLIDIDILFYDKLVVREETLIIPHPQIAFRRFTLQPLAEIAADLIHPESGKTIRALLQECTDNLPVRKVETD